jgi:K+-transporting ATPase c subunit
MTQMNKMMMKMKIAKEDLAKKIKKNMEKKHVPVIKSMIINVWERNARLAMVIVIMKLKKNG